MNQYARSRLIETEGFSLALTSWTRSSFCYIKCWMLSNNTKLGLNRLCSTTFAEFLAFEAIFGFNFEELLSNFISIYLIGNNF